MNDGHGRFVELADRAGISLRVESVPDGFGLQPEGAQAVDIDDNGSVDVIVAGKVYLNQGLPETVAGPANTSISVPRFRVCDCGIPRPVDDYWANEGTKVLDWNNDGRLDLVLHHWDRGPQLYETPGRASSLWHKQKA